MDNDDWTVKEEKERWMRISQEGGERPDYRSQILHGDGGVLGGLLAC